MEPLFDATYFGLATMGSEKAIEIFSGRGLQYVGFETGGIDAGKDHEIQISTVKWREIF